MEVKVLHLQHKFVNNASALRGRSHFFLLDANKKRNKNLHVFLKMCNFAAETNTNT